MTSERRIAANRRNARKSTGPVTAEGKRRSSRNALRHGLSGPQPLEPTVAAHVAELAIELVGDEASPIEMALARAAAEAQSDLLRVRRERESLLASLMVHASDRYDDEKPRITDLISRLDRYERRAVCRRHKALGELSRRTRLPIFG